MDMSFLEVIFQNENLTILIALFLILFATSLARIFLPKRIYFVRHGETILNKAHIRQDNIGGLSDEGKKQAQETGMRLSKMHIQHMYVSPYERTIETAGIINNFVHTPFTYIALLTERRNPSEIIGKKYDDLDVEKVVNQIDLSNHDAAYRYSDEENFTDLQNRATKLLKFLAFRPYTTILCVTHGIFLKMVLAHIVYSEKLTPLIHATLTYLTTVDNAGITLVKYNPWNFFLGKKTWSIVVFNDTTQMVGK
jgi:broad specificity phosphatase PhoE